MEAHVSSYIINNCNIEYNPEIANEYDEYNSNIPLFYLLKNKNDIIIFIEFILILAHIIFLNIIMYSLI
jgi:hypothetical protein